MHDVLAAHAAGCEHGGQNTFEAYGRNWGYMRCASDRLEHISQDSVRVGQQILLILMVSLGENPRSQRRREEGLDPALMPSRRGQHVGRSHHQPRYHLLEWAPSQPQYLLDYEGPSRLDRANGGHRRRPTLLSGGETPPP